MISTADNLWRIVVVNLAWNEVQYYPMVLCYAQKSERNWTLKKVLESLKKFVLNV